MNLKKQPERREYRLSDAYEVKENNPALELIVTQLNINPGYNTELMEKCPTLYQYMIYVEKIRSYDQHMNLADAVEKAVDECISQDILSEFLLKNKAKVTSMSIFEFDQELHNRTLYEEGREDGEKTGFIKGEESGFVKGEKSGMLTKLISLIIRKLQKGKSSEQIAEELEEDIDLVREICECAALFAPEYDSGKICEAMLEKEAKKNARDASER